MIGRVMGLPRPAWGVLAATLLAYLVGKIARRSCERDFETFWRWTVSGRSNPASPAATTGVGVEAA